MRDCGAGYPQPVLACQRHQDPWLLVPFLTGNTVETWILLGEHLRNTLLEIRFYLFFWGGAIPYDLIDLELNEQVQL